MSKMRVHELAKELGKSNKDLLNYLKENNIEVKSHMSSLEDDHTAMIKKSFSKQVSTPAQAPEKPVEHVQKVVQKTEMAAQHSEGAQAPKSTEQKKSNITQVYHPQNSRVNSNARPPQNRNYAQGGDQGSRSGNRPAGRPNNGSPYNNQNVSQNNRQNTGYQNTDTQNTNMQGMNTSTQTAANTQQTSAPQNVNAQSTAPQNAGHTAKTGDGYQGNRPAGNTYNRQQNNNGVQRQSTGYNNSQTGRPYSNAGGQSGRPANSGQARPYNNGTNSGQARPYNNSANSGQARPYNNGTNTGQARPYNNGTNSGQARPYNSGTNTGQARPYNSGTNSGQARPYNNGANSGQSRPYNNTGGGQSRPYNNNGNSGQSGRSGYSGGNDQTNRQGYSGGGAAGRPGGYSNNSQPGRTGGYAGSNRSGANGQAAGQNRNNSAGSRPNNGRPASNRPNQGSNRPNQGRYNNRGRGSSKPQQVQVDKTDEIRNIVLPEKLTLKELADKIKIPVSVIVKKLFLQGTVVTVNQELEYEAASELALEYNCIAEPEVVIDVIEELLKEDDEDHDKLVSRPPVVCVMGHVDHGKTSLLDAVRDTNVIDREAGGITQHIGAYVVTIKGQKITFLDTPGHEAFTAMRMRGANSTDIAILVIAADDGVMPQTVEAINHAKAAKIEIIVAINKMDKPSANIDRVKQELAEYELVPEDWGGDTIFVPVSAHTHEGIEQLLEMILLTAEMCELKANPRRKARGLVIEAELDKGKGPVATVLVQKGTLRIGDAIAAGACNGKVRAMMDDKGRRVKEAGPSTPVEILGLNDVPNAGEIFVGTESEKEARTFAETFISQGREKLLDDTKAKMSLDDLFTQIKAGNLKELNLIVKADVQGSVEAVKQSLVKLSNEEVVVKIIHGGVGAINESDVILASASSAIIIGFNVRPDATAKSVAEREKVDLRLYKVIYNAIEDIEAAMKGMLDPVFEEKVLGHAEIRQTFKASGIGTIAGSYVLDGLFQRGCSVRITRDKTVIFDGLLASLKRFKDDVKEVKASYECGLVFEKFNDVKEGDQVEAYTMVEVPR